MPPVDFSRNVVCIMGLPFGAVRVDEAVGRGPVRGPGQGFRPGRESLLHRWRRRRGAAYLRSGESALGRGSVRGLRVARLPVGERHELRRVHRTQPRRPGLRRCLGGRQEGAGPDRTQPVMPECAGDQLPGGRRELRRGPGSTGTNVATTLGAGVTVASQSRAGPMEALRWQHSGFRSNCRCGSRPYTPPESFVGLSPCSVGANNRLFRAGFHSSAKAFWCVLWWQ
jgi:hypothetical protein